MVDAQVDGGDLVTGRALGAGPLDGARAPSAKRVGCLEEEAAVLEGGIDQGAEGGVVPALDETVPGRGVDVAKLARRDGEHRERVIAAEHAETGHELGDSGGVAHGGTDPTGGCSAAGPPGMPSYGSPP